MGIMKIAEEFDWQHAPLSHVFVPISALLVYACVVGYLTHQPTSTRKPSQSLLLKYVMVFHNFLLSTSSFCMFIGCAFEVIQRWKIEDNTKFLFCEDPSRPATGSLYFWTYVFYLSKIWELLDTILTLGKGGRIPHLKLHVFHHIATLGTVWLWLETSMSLQWFGLLLNTAVHVVMYTYYLFKALEWPTPWKNWVTKLQIVQFFLSFLVALTMAYYVVQSSENGPWNACAGTPVVVLQLIVNVFYFTQFSGILKINRAKAKEA